MKRVNHFTFSKVESDLNTGYTRVAFLDGRVGTFEPVINSYTKQEASRLGYGSDIIHFHREHIIIHNYLCDTLGLAFSPAITKAIKEGTVCYLCNSMEEVSVKTIQELINASDIRNVENARIVSVGKTLKTVKDELWNILRS